MKGQDIRVVDADFANKPLQVHVVPGDPWMWVDSGVAGTPEAHLADLAREGAGGRHLLVVTHADVDHFGGAEALKQLLPGLLVAASAADNRLIRDRSAVLADRYEIHRPDGIELSVERRRQLVERGGPPVHVDIELTEGAVLDLGPGGRWEVLEAPGHTDGHIVLYERHHCWLFLGDAALGWSVPGADRRPLPPPYYDVRKYRSTLARLRALRVDRVFTSHFGVLDQAAAARLWDDSEEAVEAIGAAAWEALGERSCTLLELTGEVARTIGRWSEEDRAALADAVSAHLREWMADESVRRDPRRRVYSRSGRRGRIPHSSETC